MASKEHFNFLELENWLNQHHVTEIECLVPDLTRSEEHTSELQSH